MENRRSPHCAWTTAVAVITGLLLLGVLALQMEFVINPFIAKSPSVGTTEHTPSCTPLFNFDGTNEHDGVPAAVWRTCSAPHAGIPHQFISKYLMPPGTTPRFFESLVRWKYTPALIIDVGANRGSWARDAFEAFNSTPFLLVEGSAKHTGELCQAALPFTISLVGPRTKYIDWWESAERESILRVRVSSQCVASRAFNIQLFLHLHFR